MNFTDNNYSILYAKPFEFRKGYSTSHAIVGLVDEISKVLDRGKW